MALRVVRTTAYLKAIMEVYGKQLQVWALNEFSFLKEGLPSWKTACAPCVLGTPPNLFIVYTNKATP